MARNRMPGRLSTATEFWIWHRFRDFCGVHLGQAAIRMRLRSRSNFARPYICRLIILMRLTVPSTGPELSCRVRPLSTAVRPRCRPAAKECRCGRSSARTWLIQLSRRSPLRPALTCRAVAAGYRGASRARPDEWVVPHRCRRSRRSFPLPARRGHLGESRPTCSHPRRLRSLLRPVRGRINGTGSTAGTTVFARRSRAEHTTWIP